VKILYGLSGEGFGHSSRAKTILPYLEKKGHEVKIMTYGQASKVLKREGSGVFDIRGMHIVFRKGSIRKRETLFSGLKSFASNLKKNEKIRKLMKNNFDLCITDMEPLASILSFWHKIPLLCIDNQHRLVNMELRVPRKYYHDFLIAKLVTKAFVPRADWYIVTTFANGRIKNKYRKNTFLVPPLIRQVIKESAPKKGESILVYLTKKNHKLLGTLKHINRNFLVYGWDTEKKDGNLVFRKSGNRFTEDLAKCKAIIATAGFTLISEALYLKKPYFALPLKGQFEQTLNALFLKRSKLGEYSDNPDKQSIAYFLDNLEEYRKKLNKYNPDYDLLFKKLDFVLDQVSKNEGK